MDTLAEFDDALLCWEMGDTAKAIELWQVAATGGDSRAQLQIGLCFELGLGTKVDCSVAACYFKQAAEAGNAEAQFSLATLFRDGRGVPRDYALAIKLFQTSATSGITESQTALGSMVGAGMGVPRDTAEASRWYRMAAHQGDRDAQFMLGTLYLSGEGVPKNASAAMDWFRQAAEAGDVEAQFNLGIGYFRGQGVPRDITTSHKWLNLSKVGGFARAPAFLEAVASEMTHDQITCAIAMAQEFSARSQRARHTMWGDGERQRLVDTLRSVGTSTEHSLEMKLGYSLYSALDSVSRDLLLKAEAEHCSRRDGSELSAAFLQAKAFESEFNIRVRDPIFRSLIDIGHADYPDEGDLKLIRNRRGNKRLTPGQVIRFIQQDLVVQRLVRTRGQNPGVIVRQCEPVITLRNQVVHGNITPECAALLRGYLIGKASVFATFFAQSQD